MKFTLQLFSILLLFTNSKLQAQEIKLGGNAFIRIPGGTAAQNTFVGINSGIDNSSGQFNSFFGSFAGRFNTSGARNTFIGVNAGNVNSSGGENTFVGAGAGIANNQGGQNVFIGSSAGNSNMAGGQNSYLGYQAGFYNTTGVQNVFMGNVAGFSNSEGIQNAFVGSGAGYGNSTGNSNTFFGTNAGAKNTTGTGNVFIGFFTGQTHTTGQYNTLLGYGAEVGSSALTNAAAIGFNARVAVSDAIVLGDASNGGMKVGIGTDSPAYRLDVKGVINMRIGSNSPSLKINDRDFLGLDSEGNFLVSDFKIKYNHSGQWSDKVFEKNYRLAPIEEVMEFAVKNKHLPNIPTAREVVENGVEIHTIVAKLLEKVEELTMYSAKQNEEIQSLRKRLNAIENK